MRRARLPALVHRPGVGTQAPWPCHGKKTHVQQAFCVLPEKRTQKQQAFFLLLGKKMPQRRRQAVFLSCSETLRVSTLLLWRPPSGFHSLLSWGDNTARPYIVRQLSCSTRPASPAVFGEPFVLLQQAVALGTRRAGDARRLLQTAAALEPRSFCCGCSRSLGRSRRLACNLLPACDTFRPLCVSHWPSFSETFKYT